MEDEKMNFRTVLTLFLIGFVVFCAALVVESGLFNTGRGVGQSCILLQQKPTEQNRDLSLDSRVTSHEPRATNLAVLGADNAPAKIVYLGAADPATEDPDVGFKLGLELSTKGAAISKATFSNGNDKGFDDRDYKNPQPLIMLAPVQLADGSKIFSMANKELVFVEQKLQLPLHKLHWESFEVEKAADGSQTARFEAVTKDKDSGQGIIKLVKTYSLSPGSYLLDCDITLENLSAAEQNVRFNLAGPLGIGREDVRGDAREVVAGFRDSQGQVTSARIKVRKLAKAQNLDDGRLIRGSDRFLWAAVTNKYFAAILLPLPDDDKEFCDWAADKTGRFHNPDDMDDSGDETIGVDLKIAASTLAATGQSGSTKTYKFQLYLGPKDKSFFDKNDLYQNLGFVHTITFMPCFCCPATIIKPLSFGILTLMKWMYEFIGNYGVVIIILVFLIRLCMHPITKKSQISMSKFSKLAPKAAELKKKYANNKAELNKQTMALYRKQGASPIMGFLPMIFQMPIWIALYSAINASIELRGAAFLPIWITDLSVPDALVRFSAITLPLFGKLDSFNLLPILMGLAMYLQQKMTPSPAAAGNPQAAQQQKMMMVMMTLMFPLMLYKAPSGLNLYIMSSLFAGVIEQHIIRKHIKEKEQAESTGLVSATSKTGGKVKKKKPKPFYKNM
jgi:YidC/Oxa1 family membrane protein insertase